MKRAPAPRWLPGASLLSVLSLVALLTGQAHAETMVFRDGSRMEVLRYELDGDLVVLTAPNGKLLSVPRGSVDLEATEASNRKPDPANDPAGEALRLLDLRHLTDEIARAARGAGEDQLAATPRYDPRSESLRAALREGFDPDRFYQITIVSFREKADALAWNEILPWLRSELVQRLSRNSNQEPSASSLEEFRTGLASNPPSLSRLQLIERLDRASGTSTGAVVMEIALMKALLAAMNPSFDSEGRLSRAQIEELAERSRPGLLDSARERVRLLLLYRYRSASDRDLRQYLSFLESQGGLALGRSVLESLVVAMEDASLRTGKLLGARLRDLEKTKSKTKV